MKNARISTSKVNGECSVFPYCEVEETQTLSHLYQSLSENDPTLIIIDSAIFLHYHFQDEYQFRKPTQKLVNTLTFRDCISPLLFEPLELEKETSLAVIVNLWMPVRKRGNL